ncbi:MAG: PilZ domain-containing protein [bacterium]
MTGQERREHLRYNFNGAPILMHQDGPITGVTVDISSGGLGLILETPLELGMETTLELFHQRIRIKGTITNLSRIGKDRYQVGVSFQDIEPGLVDGMRAVWGYRHSAAAKYV